MKRRGDRREQEQGRTPPAAPSANGTHDGPAPTRPPPEVWLVEATEIVHGYHVTAEPAIYGCSPEIAVAQRIAEELRDAWKDGGRTYTGVQIV